MPMRQWPKPRPALAAGWTFTTRSASTRAWVIARRGKFTRKACGYVDDRRCRPAALPPLPERARKAGKCSPSPTYPQALRSTKRFISMLRKAGAYTSHCTDNNRSRHRNRPGYTLTSGSGCLTNGVHLSRVYVQDAQPPYNHQLEHLLIFQGAKVLKCCVGRP